MKKFYALIVVLTIAMASFLFAVTKLAQKEPTPKVAEPVVEAPKVKPKFDAIHKFIDESLWVLEAQVPRALVPKIYDRFPLADFNLKRLADNFARAGTIETWSSNPSDDTQMCRIRTSPENHELNPVSRSLEVKYDVESRMKSANGFWIRLDDIDVREFDYLSFWIKGDPQLGFTKTLGIGFIDSVGEPGIYQIRGISPEWQNILLPLDKTRVKIDQSSISKLYVIFKQALAEKLKGRLFIDDIELIQARE